MATTTQQNQSQSLSSLLYTLQNGVTALNNLLQIIQTLLPAG